MIINQRGLRKISVLILSGIFLTFINIFAQETAKEAVDKGREYEVKSKYDKEIAEFTKAIEINPNDANAYLKRGLAYVKKGNYNQAISDYTKAIEIIPDYIEYYYNRGLIYEKQGNFTQAISDFTKAIEIEPESAKPHYARGLIYEQQGNLTQAISDYTKAIEKNPKYVKPYYAHGLVYEKQGNFTQAISDYTKVIEIYPDEAEAYYKRGLAYYITKEFDKAWADVYKAEELEYAVSPEFIAKLKQASGRDTVPVQEDNLFSPQEIEKVKRCEELISKAMVAFKERKYELLHSYIFQPPYYGVQDINDDREYFIGLSKMIEEELGILENYLKVPLKDIPEEWLCFGESVVSTNILEGTSTSYIKAYKASFSKIKSFPIYIYVWVYPSLDKYSVRDFGIILPSPFEFGDGFYPYREIKEIEDVEKKRSIFNILFLEQRLMKHYAENKGELYKKAKILADAPTDQVDVVEYFLPTQEGKFITLMIDYQKRVECVSENAEIQKREFLYLTKLQDGEQVYTFLNKENEPLKLKVKFKDGKIISQVFELDSTKEESAYIKKISVESQKGLLIDFDVRYSQGKIANVEIMPRVQPFSAGCIYSFWTHKDIEDLKKVDLDKSREDLKREFNLD